MSGSERENCRRDPDKLPVRKNSPYQGMKIPFFKED